MQGIAAVVSAVMPSLHMSYPGNNLDFNTERLGALQTCVNSEWFGWIATGPASIPVASPGLGIAGGKKSKEKKIGTNTAVETALILVRGAW